MVKSWDGQEWSPNLPELDQTIHTLEGLARVVNGRDSFVSPGFSKARAAETVQNWNKWVIANAPKP